MRSADNNSSGTLERISLAGRQVEFRLVRSRSATKLRVRVGPGGVEVFQPRDRDDESISDFLRNNTPWIVNEIERVERLRGIRRSKHHSIGHILYRGEPTPVRIEEIHRGGANRVVFDSGRLIVLRSTKSKTPPATTLESWLRKQARSEILRHLQVMTVKLKREPANVLIMGQRTKWGNCSPLRNLSFNWRLIMAPEFVLHYLVTHEAVHLAVPDHSHKFWLTVRSLSRDTERARQWLCANGHRLLIDLADVCAA